MRSVSKRQKLHDPEAVCSVTSFTARPLLRVGGKDKGTRFLSFVDSMIGFRHLLTEEDLNKAASLCTSMKGQLKSRFMVLSDDKALPPPPNSRRKRTISHDEDQGPDEDRSQPSKTSRTSRPGGSHATKSRNNQTGESAPYDSDTFQVVTGKRSRRRLPEGVSPVPTRTTPGRAAKGAKSSQNQDNESQDNDAMSENESGSNSDADADGAGSDKTVVDWVTSFNVLVMSCITNLLRPFSTVSSLSITDSNSFFGSIVGRLIASRRLIISLWTVIVVLSW